MSDRIIEITKSVCNEQHPTKSYLVLSDGASSVVEPRDEVTWVVTDKNIDSILIQDDRSINLFVPDPAPEGNDFRTWKGTIRHNLKAGDEENYKIYWSQNKKVYCYDPKIQINN